MAALKTCRHAVAASKTVEASAMVGVGPHDNAPDVEGRRT